MKPQDYNISSEKLQFRSKEVVLHDTKLETKPISYFRDALNRFTKNKASIVAAFIIALLVLFAIFGPLFTPYQVKDADGTYAYVLPKNELFYKVGIPLIRICTGTDYIKEINYAFDELKFPKSEPKQTQHQIYW